jgi:carbon-monoxide dehydrogenase small subunit
MVITARDMLARGCCGSAAQIRTELAGNLCRCTGYGGIVKAIELARDSLKERAGDTPAS